MNSDTRRGNYVDCAAAHSLRMADLRGQRHCARCRRIGVCEIFLAFCCSVCLVREDVPSGRRLTVSSCRHDFCLCRCDPPYRRASGKTSEGTSTPQTTLKVRHLRRSFVEASALLARWRPSASRKLCGALRPSRASRPAFLRAWKAAQIAPRVSAIKNPSQVIDTPQATRLVDVQIDR